MGGRLWAVLLGVPLGTALQLQQTALLPLWLYAMGAAVAAAAIALWVGWDWLAGHHRRGRQGSSWGSVGAGVHLVAVGLVVVALCFSATGWRAVHQTAQRLPAALEGRDLQLQGWVAELPRRGERGWSMVFAVEHARVAGEPVQVPARVRLSWSEFVPTAHGPLQHDLRVGQHWAFDARLVRPHGLSNPVGFDAERWLWQQRVHATGHVRQRMDHKDQRLQGAQLLGSTWRFPVEQLRQWVRDRVLRWVQPTSAAGVLSALVAGDQSAISRSHWEVFRLTGVTHLVVVSGMHITLFAWLAMTAIAWLWRAAGRRWPRVLLAVPVPVAASVGGVLLGGAYALFSGWGVPAQRAFWMLATAIVLKRMLKVWPWPLQWLAVFAVVVLWDPWAMLSPGFWLSFVAVGILFATATTPWEAGHGWRQQARNMVRTQGLVTVALAPLTLLWFGQFSVVGLVANVLAIPWVTMVVTPLAIAGAVVAPVWIVGGWAVQILLAWLEFWAAVPWASVMRPALPLGLGLLTVCGGLLVVMRLPWRWRWVAVCLLWPALTYEPSRPASGSFEVIAPDIGQGTAVLVRTQRHTLVYDTGPPMGPHNDAASAVLIPWLQQRGEQPQRVVVSHADADHASGLAALAAYAPQAYLLTSFDTEPLGLPSQRCEAGQRWEWDGVPFEVLHPTAHDYTRGLSTNAISCVLRVGHAGADVLLTGDITVAEELSIIRRHPELRVHGLFAAHHGSITSTGPAWLNSLQPQWVMVQSGWRNPFGHPSPDVTDRLHARSIPWFNSPQCGAMTWQSQRPNAVHCHRTHQKRYWHTDTTLSP